MKYRKKPVEIDAVQMPTSEGDFTRAPEWVHDAMKSGAVHYVDEQTFNVRTLEGVMAGRAGDFLIRGVAGEMYPCRRDIFIATYERVGYGVPLTGSGA